jgi:hypothetical protein
MRFAVCLLAFVATHVMAAENETFHGWSKDGSWLVFELHGEDDRNELYFCATEPEGQPSWPNQLDEMDRETVGELSCVRFLDPNKAPYQWKLQLVLPHVSTKFSTITLSNELATIGEQGFVLESGDKKQICYASGTREGSKLEKTWFHSSGRYVAAQIDGNFRHCVITLVPTKPPKVVKPPPPPKGGAKPKNKK